MAYGEIRYSAVELSPNGTWRAPGQARRASYLTRLAPPGKATERRKTGHRPAGCGGACRPDRGRRARRTFDRRVRPATLARFTL